MSARSEVIAAIEAALGSDQVYTMSLLDSSSPAPSDAAPPYVVLYMDISESVTFKGDGRTQAIDGDLQVSLFMSLTDESPSLVESIRSALDGLKLVDGLTVRWNSTQRLPDPDANLVHRAILCTMVRRV